LPRRQPAAPAPPQPGPWGDPEGPALPAAPGQPVVAQPPWGPAPAPIREELLRSSAEQLTRLVYGWHPDIRVSAQVKTAAALSDLRSAIDVCLLFGDYQR